MPNGSAYPGTGVPGGGQLGSPPVPATPQDKPGGSIGYPPSNGGNGGNGGNGNGGDPGNGNGNGMKQDCGCQTEIWQCNGGLTPVECDAAGCPIDQRFCKTQAGDEALGVASGATFTLTISATNFTEARVRGFVMAAQDPAAAGAGLDMLDGIVIDSIEIQGTQEINGPVPARRYTRDATGAVQGTGQYWRGKLGTTGGDLIVIGRNLNAVTVNVFGVADINAVRG